MERRFLLQGLSILRRHSPRRKNNDRGNIRLKNVQAIVDLSFVRNDYANWVGHLPAFNSCFAQICLRQTKSDIVPLERDVAAQNNVGQRTLMKQEQLVVTRKEINR